MSLQCIERQTSASNRPLNVFLWMALKTADDIRYLVSAPPTSEEGLPKPTDATAQCAIALITSIQPYRLIADPDVDPFYGEIHVSWRRGAKQVVLMCFPNQGPMVHYHRGVLGAPSEHGIHPASPETLAHWLGWLHE